MKRLPLDGDRLRELAAEHGTPLYLLDLDVVRERLAMLEGFDVVRYAQKANGNPSLLRLLADSGAAVDAVSAGEIERALATGFEPEAVQYTADLFTPASLSLVGRYGLSVNVGSTDMLEQLAEALPGSEVTVRVNPGFGDGLHQGVSTGGEMSKHGIWHEELPEAYRQAEDLGLCVTGLHVHVGSGFDPATTNKTIEALSRVLYAAPETVETLSTGGGLPFPYRPGEQAFDVASFTASWLDARQRWQTDLGRALRLEVEPGRHLVGEAGFILATVRTTKRTPDRQWALVDAGFHTLLRPALYGAHHHISAIGRDGEEGVGVIVAGPLCESTDVLTVDDSGRPESRSLPEPRRGDLYCIHDAGAYGASMASTYNSQRLPAEVVIEAGLPRLSVRAQDRDELLDREVDS